MYNHHLMPNRLSLDYILLQKVSVVILTFKCFFVDFYVYVKIAGRRQILLANQFWNIKNAPLVCFQDFRSGFTEKVRRGQLVSPTTFLQAWPLELHASRFCSRAAGRCLGVCVLGKLPWRLYGTLQLRITCRVQKSQKKIISPTHLNPNQSPTRRRKQV